MGRMLRPGRWRVTQREESFGEDIAGHGDIDVTSVVVPAVNLAETEVNGPGPVDSKLVLPGGN
jgi:hypothetical protein